jgi:hypothetical protein
MLPTKDVYTLAHLMDAFDRTFPRKRTALVAQSEEIASIARIFKALREPGEGVIGVFNNLPDALEWLELPPSTGDPFDPAVWETANCIRAD